MTRPRERNATPSNTNFPPVKHSWTSAEKQNRNTNSQRRIEHRFPRRNQRELAHLVPLRVVTSRVAQVPDVQNQAQLRLDRPRGRLLSSNPSRPNLDAPEVVFEDAHRSEGCRFVGVPGVELLGVMAKMEKKAETVEIE